LRLGRVSNRDYFVVCFVYVFHSSFFVYFLGFCAVVGVQGLPKGPPGGTLKSQLGAKIELRFPEGPRERFRVPKVTILEVIWECFGSRV
jgi:hypothetical protein